MTVARARAPATPRQGRPNVVRRPSASSPSDQSAQARATPSTTARPVPVVGAAGAEPVVAEPEDDRGKRDDDRERERERREAHELARRAAPGVQPDSAGADPDDEAEDEVPGGAVEEGADERDDREDEPVERLVVEQRAPGGREEDAGHPREDHDREDRLGAGLDVDLVVVAERDEHLPRAREQPGHAPPPRADARLGEIRARPRLRVGGRARLGLLVGHGPERSDSRTG